jgi:hypothetical protein
MSKFKDYRSLNGSNSRVTKKSKGIATPIQVLDLVAQPTGHFIAVRKGEMREPVTARVAPRKLVSVTESMSDDEKAMYIQLCQLAAQA